MSKRFHELDSLRGLAALTVVFSHFMLVYNINFIDTQSLGLNMNWYKHTPLHIFWAGGEAVILFFILSGFVLFLPFSKQSAFSYRDFFIKRIFRIYPASIVAILVAFALYLISIDNLRLTGSQWINSMWASVTGQGVVSDIFLLGYGGSGLNPVLWSLVHEIRLSFLFPIIAYVVMRYDWKKVLAVAVAFSLIGYVLMTIFSTSNTSAVSTLHYSGTFVVGALLAKHRSVLMEKVSRINLSGKLLMLIAAIMLYILGWIISNQLVFHNNFFINWATTAGASIFIILSLSSLRISNLLELNIIQFFGRISYSLYLYHMIFLIFFIKINSELPMPLVLLLTFIVSVIAATISYNYIEKPTIVLGRNVVETTKEQKLKQFPQS